MSNEATQFKPGQSGNPNGRPKGSRQKLSDAFIHALANDFIKHGADTIEVVRKDKPDAYLGTIGKLMPKLMELSGPDGGDIPLSGKVTFVKSKDDEA